MHLNTPYYPKLVKEFFANIVSKDEVNLRNIVSYVNNVLIDLIETVLRRVLGIDDLSWGTFCFGLHVDSNYTQ